MSRVEKLVQPGLIVSAYGVPLEIAAPAIVFTTEESWRVIMERQRMSEALDANDELDRIREEQNEFLIEDEPPSYY